MKANLASRETGTSEEFPNRNARRLLAKSFTVAELEYVHQDPQFQKAVAKMNSLDSFEKAVTLGHLLLIERDERNIPSNVIKETRTN